MASQNFSRFPQKEESTTSKIIIGILILGLIILIAFIYLIIKEEIQKNNLSKNNNSEKSFLSKSNKKSKTEKFSYTPTKNLQEDIENAISNKLSSKEPQKSSLNNNASSQKTEQQSQENLQQPPQETSSSSKLIITILFPINGNTYSTDSINFEYSIAGNTVDSCWFSSDNGKTNLSVICNEIIPYTASVGLNTLTIYANNSSGDIFSNSTTFRVEFSNLAEDISKAIDQKV